MQTNASEVFQFAIKIEENGEKFYRELANKINNKFIKNIFNILADEEVVHAKIFSDMLSQFESYTPTDYFPEEYFVYLKTLVDNEIFNTNKLDEKIDSITTGEEAIKLAIRKELDSILYYQEMKKMLPPDQYSLIDKILEQERIHFMRLTNIEV